MKKIACDLCGEAAESIFMGLSLCDLHREVADSHTEDWTTVTTGALYQWLWRIEQIVQENPRAITVEEQEAALRALVPWGMVPILMDEVHRRREQAA